MALLYELGMQFFSGALHLASLFNAKARKWVAGRRGWRERYAAGFQKKNKVLWVHAASLGEFEQGRPLIEGFREKHPGWQIVLTFFSPSGYEIRKNYPQADFVCYLPADTRRNARDFLAIIQPDAAIFVKYEFWANYLLALKKRSAPTLLVSALFRENQPFFRWYGAFWRRMLACFQHFFVQNRHSEQLLQSIGFQNITVAGDTRVDRVLALAATAPENERVAAFARRGAGEKILIAGSSWEADEAIFLPALAAPECRHFKSIIAPHEPSDRQVNRLVSAMPDSIRYSQATPENLPAARTLLIDNIGMLNTLYRYGDIAYIGGGFGTGIHNTLEPAAYGLPIIFGPNYQKFEEARQLVARGGAFSIRNTAELIEALRRLDEPETYRRASEQVQAFLLESRGATETILKWPFL